ncbi:helix-turn-helix domain-containing protein [Enterococcus sp. LJL98]
MNVEHYEIESLFGLDKEFVAKNIILHLLDNSSYLTTKEITSFIAPMGKISLDTIQSICRKLKEDISKLYTIDECQLIIEPGLGLKLVRKKGNLKRVLDYYANQELSFILLQRLLQHREVISIDFLEEQHISESTLRRKIKAINVSLNKYKIHITYSHRIKLTGNETAIRSFHFHFLVSTHRQLEKLLPENEYFQLEKNVINILRASKQSLNPRDIYTFKLAFFAFETGVLAKKIFLSEKQKEIINQFSIPEKPSFLNYWSVEDWSFFITFVYASDYIEYDLITRLNRKNNNVFQAEGDSWIFLFESRFRKLKKNEKKIVYQTIQKSFIMDDFFSITDELFLLLRIVSFEEIAISHPIYYRKFLLFWDNIIATNNFPINKNFQLVSLLLIILFEPLSGHLPVFNIAIYSEQSTLFSNYLANLLKISFTKKYHLIFTPDFKKADVILSTVPLIEEECLGKKSLIINSILSKKDLELVEQTFNSLLA